MPARGAKVVARGIEGKEVSAIAGAARVGEGGEAAIKAAGDAAQARPPTSAVQGEHLRTELDEWAKMTPDTSRDAEYIAKTDNQVLQQNNFDMDHVLTGEVNAKGKATGYHAEFAADGAARIKPGADITYNANGTYEAPVQVWDAKKGVWVDKGRESTFFPPSWSHARIDYEVSEAFKKGAPGTSFVQPSPSGIDIQFHWDTKSQRTTFYPLKEATP